MTQQQEHTAAQVAAIVTKARKAKGLSRRAAAKLAGISASTWDNIERSYYVSSRTGETTPTTPTAENLIKIAEPLGINPENLLNIAGYPPEAASIALPAPPTTEVIDISDMEPDEQTEMRDFLATVSEMDPIERAKARGFLAGLMAARNHK